MDADTPGTGEPTDVPSWFARIGPPYPAIVGREHLEAADAAVAAFPNAAVLWVARGDLIQLLGAPLTRWPTSEIERSYARAIDAEPDNAIGYEELGIWLDLMYEDRRDEAAGILDDAILRGAGPHAYVARARLHAEAGEAQPGLMLLRQSPFADHEAILEMIREIERGDWNPDS
ncbi:MAG: hypothetical protein KDC95_08615 [Planctomycetes bacterium]|nr:hypothetical protein [Planctomycetota bacterium]